MRLKRTCDLEQVSSLTLNLRCLVCTLPFSPVGKKQAVGSFEVWVALGPVGDMPCLLTLQMECEAERRPLGVFECQLCALTAPYSYVGQQPPGAQSVA